MKFNVLMASESDAGGAGLACRRLHQAINTHSPCIQSDWLLKSNKQDIDNLHQLQYSGLYDRIYSGMQAKIGSKFSRWASLMNRTQSTLAWPNTLFPKYLKRNFSSVDAIHLHSIGSGLLSLNQLKSIKCPIIWTLHDEWPTHGTLHYSRLDTVHDYSSFCQTMLISSSLDPSIFTKASKSFAKFLSHRIRKNIEKCISNVDLFITPSRWLASQVCLNISSFEPRCLVIPNPIDLSFWKPMDKAWARNELRMCQDAKYILYVGTHLSDPRKGHALLKEASFILKQGLVTDSTCCANSIRLAIVGPSYSVGPNEYGLALDQLGAVSDERTMRMVYSAVDVVCIPSLADNLPNVATEAQSCGIPVVCFNVGGLPEIVHNNHSGIVCSHTSPFDLARALQRLIGDQNLLSYMSEISRQEAKNKWDERMVVSTYEAALSSLLNQFS